MSYFGENLKNLRGLTSMTLAEAASFRMLPGADIVDKFGVNPVIATGNEDVWEGGGLYNYDTFGTAPIVSIGSTSTEDTQEIIVTGLDITGSEVEQSVTLQGQTRVVLDTALWRVYRLESNADEGDDIAGTVSCYIGTESPTSVTLSNLRAVILNGNNQTQMALYTIPKGKIGFLYRGEIGAEYTGGVGAGTNFAKVQYKSRRLGKVFKTKKEISVVSAANSNYVDRRDFPDIIPDLTDIKIHVKETSEEMGVWSTFFIMLFDDTLFDSNFMSAIGQSGY